MTVEEFAASDGKRFSGALLALWWDARGDWEKAHQVAQDVAGRDGAWVHAYLHRKEGDLGNAGYWYRQAEWGRLPGMTRTSPAWTVCEVPSSKSKRRAPWVMKVICSFGWE